MDQKEANDLIDEACVAIAKGAQDVAAEMDRLRSELAAARAQHEIDVDYLRQAEDDRDRLIDALAAARAAMPTDADVYAIRDVLTWARVHGYARGERVGAWLARLSAYHAAHPAASPADQSTPFDRYVRRVLDARPCVCDDVCWRCTQRTPEAVPPASLEGGRTPSETVCHPSRGNSDGPSGFDAAYGSEPDLPEPCALCSEALCECEVCLGDGRIESGVMHEDGYELCEPCTACNGTGRAGGGGHE